MRRIKTLLDMRADVNAVESFSTGTALTRAVLSSDERVVKMLLEAKASVQEVIVHGSCLQADVHEKDTREWLAHVLAATECRQTQTPSVERGDEKQGGEGVATGPREKEPLFCLEPLEGDTWDFPAESKVHRGILMDHLQAIAQAVGERFLRGLKIASTPEVSDGLFADDPVWALCLAKHPMHVRHFVKFAYSEACREALGRLEEEICESELGAFASPIPMLLEMAHGPLTELCERMVSHRGERLVSRSKKEDFFKRFLTKAMERLGELSLGDFSRPDAPAGAGGGPDRPPSRIFEIVRDIVRTPSTLGKTSRLFMATGGGAFCVGVLKDGIMNRTRKNKHGFQSLVPFWRHMRGGIRGERGCDMGPILTRSLASVVAALGAKLGEGKRANAEVDVDGMWLLELYYLELYYTVSALLNLGADLPPLHSLKSLQGSLHSPSLQVLEPCRKWFKMRLESIVCEKVAGLDDGSCRVICAYLHGYAPSEECLDPRVLQSSWTA